MIYAVFLGGGLGASLRYLISQLLLKYDLLLPYHTLLANVIGCFIAGFIMALLLSKSGVNPIYKPLIITGFCGGLTTFSTFSLEAIEYLLQGYYLKAIGYIIVSLLVSIAAAFIGIYLVKKFLI